MTSFISKFGVSCEFMRFLGVGVLNTIVGLSCIFVAKGVGFGDIAANAIGYAIGIVVSFSLNSRLTFSYQGARFPAALKFLLASGGAYLMNLLTVLFAIHVLKLNDYLAQMLGTPAFTLTNYLLSKYLVFRETPHN